MAVDLTDVYDKGVGADDQQGDPSSGFRQRVNERVKALPINNLRYDSPVHTSPSDVGEYDGYAKSGVFDRVRNIDEERGQNQSAWDKWGNMAAGIVPKIATSLLEGVGYMGSLLTEWGDNRDYSNGLTEAAKDANATIDGWFPMYRKNNDTFALGDAAWWTQNIQGLAVSASSFALEGVGFAKLFGAVAKGAEALGAGRKVIGMANTAAEYLTSGALAYTEGAMMGKDIYDKTYDTQLRNNLRARKPSGEAMYTYEEAHAAASHIAAQSAATTVQLNTMINTGLNLEALSGLFAHKNEDLIRAFWKKEGKQGAGETFENFSKRVRTGTDVADKAISKQIFKHEGAIHYGKSAAFEGIEELTNQFAQKTGESLGQEWDSKKMTGRTKGMFEQLNEMEHYFERTMDKEGALSFVLGAVGGVAQSGLIDNAIPLHRVTSMDANGKAVEVVNEDGKVVVDDKGNKKYKQEWVTARAKGKYHDRLYFNNVRDAVIQDLGTFDDMKTKMAQARVAGHHDQADAIGQDMLNSMNFNAVHMGMASNYAETFKEMAETDNTTAERDINIKPQYEALTQQIDQMEDGVEKDAAIAQREELLKQYDDAGEVTEAMRKGLAKDMNDNEFKKKANENIEDLHQLEKIHAKVQRKYGSEDNPAVQRVADVISNRKMSLYVQNSRINRLETELNAIQAEQDAMFDSAGDALEFNKEVVKHNQSISVEIEMQKRYQDQMDMLNNAIGVLKSDPNDSHSLALINNMIRKYSVVGLEGVADPNIVTQLINTIKHRHAVQVKRVEAKEDLLFNTVGYKKWIAANPEGKFEDFAKIVGSKHDISKELLLRKAYLSSQKDEYEEGNKQLMELESEKGLRGLKSKSEALYSELQKKTAEARQKAIIEMSERNRQLIATEKELLRSNNKLQSKYQAELISLQGKYQDLVDKIAILDSKLAAFANSEGILVFTKQSVIDAWGRLGTARFDAARALQNVRERLVEVQSLFDTLAVEINYKTSMLYDKEETTTPRGEVVKENEADDEPDTQEEPQQATAVAEEQPLATNQAITNVDEAMKLYKAEMTMLPTAIQSIVQNYELAVKASNGTVSLDYLSEQVKDGRVQQEDAARVLMSLRGYVAAIQIMENEAQAEAENANAELATLVSENVMHKLEEEEDEEESIEDSGFVEESESTVTQLPSQPELVFESEAADERRTDASGKKAESVIKPNSLALGYSEFKDTATGRNRRFSQVDKLNPNASRQLLFPEFLKEGTEVRFEVDTEYIGDVSITDRMSNDEYGDVVGRPETVGKYLTGDKKVNMEPSLVNNVPIKIVAKDGSTIGWLPRMEWVESKYEGAEGEEDLTNVVHYIVDKDGNTIDNLAIQVADLNAVRTAIAEAHNAGKPHVTTTVVSKGPGMLIYNWVLNKNTEKSKIVWDRASNMLPGDVKLGVVTKAGVMVNDGDPMDNGLVIKGKNFNKYNNVPVAILPAANGKFFVAPLLSRMLWDEAGSKSDFNTMVRAIEIFMTHKHENVEIATKAAKDAADIGRATDIDILTEAGLRKFINQYFTYTKPFDDSVIAMNRASGRKSVIEFVFKIEEKLEGQARGSIKVGTTFSGKLPMEATLKEGKLSADFINALRDGLGSRRKNVNLTKRSGAKGVNSAGGLIGINSTGKFVSPMVRSNGVWAFTEHESYNDYVKSNTTTNVYGKNTLDGRHVYAVHAQVKLDVNKILNREEVVIASTTETSPSDSDSTQSHDEADLDFFDSLMSMSPTRSKLVTIENVVGQEAGSGPAVSMASLTERYNFTPIQNRNGKSVEEVLDDMQRLGIPYLVNGYNPFSRCI